MEKHASTVVTSTTDGIMSSTVKNTTNPKPQPKRQKWWLFLLVPSLLFSSLLIITLSASNYINIPTNMLIKTHIQNHPNSKPSTIFVESRLKISPTSKNRIPRIAYLISGTTGDGESLKRALRALYHPLNQYVLHLDLEASPEERMEIVDFVRSDPIFSRVGNVRVVVKSNLVTYRGPTMVTNTLHAASILFKEGGDWDWFINLSASDYPLVTQDDLLHTLSNVPRDLNFIEHTSDIGWKEYQRARPVIIDPGLYSTRKSDVFWVPEQRRVPTAFKLFTGSAWMMLSRPFIEYCIWGWDDLPRIVLMYYANFLSSPEGYFHTVICNSDEFKKTTVSHDLHFISWDNPPKQHPHYLTMDDFDRMVKSNAPFARKFRRGSDEPVLDKIDFELLGRDKGGFSSGGWWVARGEVGAANMTNLGYGEGVADAIELRAGPGAARLRRLIDDLLSSDEFRLKKQCG